MKAVCVLREKLENAAVKVLNAVIPETRGAERRRIRAD
jgi:hypothetical protein